MIIIVAMGMDISAMLTEEGHISTIKKKLRRNNE